MNNPSTQVAESPLKPYYTPQGQHPEDRIYTDKQYINRLQIHMGEVFQQLARDLRLNQEGEEMLFDFVYNEEKACEFSDILNQAGVNYTDIASKA
jgi:hypothetical protein